LRRGGLTFGAGLVLDLGLAGPTNPLAERRYGLLSIHELNRDPPPISHIRQVRSEDGAVRQPDGFAMENLIAFRNGEYSVVPIGMCHSHFVLAVEGRQRAQ
jgi:hypothetical protein